MLRQQQKAKELLARGIKPGQPYHTEDLIHGKASDLLKSDEVEDHHEAPPLSQENQDESSSRTISSNAQPTE
jgi:hypothetical protein